MKRCVLSEYTVYSKNTANWVRLFFWTKSLTGPVYRPSDFMYVCIIQLEEGLSFYLKHVKRGHWCLVVTVRKNKNVSLLEWTLLFLCCAMLVLNTNIRAFNSYAETLKFKNLYFMAGSQRVPQARPKRQIQADSSRSEGGRKGVSGNPKEHSFRHKNIQRKRPLAEKGDCTYTKYTLRPDGC